MIRQMKVLLLHREIVSQVRLQMLRPIKNQQQRNLIIKNKPGMYDLFVALAAASPSIL